MSIKIHFSRDYSFSRKVKKERDHIENLYYVIVKGLDNSYAVEAITKLMKDHNFDQWKISELVQEFYEMKKSYEEERANE